MRKKGKSGHYYARFYDRHRTPTRKEIPLRTTRKDVARRRLTDLERRFEKGEYDPWAGPGGLQPLNLQEAVERFLKAKEPTVQPRTLQTYGGLLTRWVRQCPTGIMLADVSPEHIRPYVYASTRERGEKSLSPASRHKRYRHVKAFLRWCQKAGHLSESPLGGIEEPDKGRSIPAYLSPDELDRLLEYIDWHAANKPNACGIKPDLGWLRNAILIAVCTGLRRGELLNLRWEDVDLKGRRLYVRNRDGFRTKSGSERVVPVRGPALDVLQRLEAARTAGSGPVLLDRRGKPLRPGRLSRRFKDMVREAKVKGRERLRFHSLRHTTGAWLASKGVSARIILEILGHATPATTEIYSHIAGPAVEDAMERVFGK